MRIIIVLRPRQFYGVPLECILYYHASEKVICLSRGWYDDRFMVILSLNIQNLCSP
ncbi:hypothetical protein G2285_00211 [Escherichia phage vB_EcoM_G2285]|nr:hypothetical protein G2285_00211 [Escherichia phage vB_EcoM_G2285]